MLNRSITYRSLLRIIGALFLLWALYQAFRIATAQVYANGDSIWQYEIFYSIIDTLFNFAWYGVLIPVALSIVFFAVSLRRVALAYWGIQLALWVAGYSLWYQTNDTFLPLPLDPLWIIITAICSFVLLLLYWPVTRFIRWLGGISSPGRMHSVEALDK